MPIIETPTRVNEPNEPAGNRPDAPGAVPDPSSHEEEPRPKGRTSSRWVDYDTHELLEMISELEDERRWARLREGVLWAVLFHILLISAITWIPRYVFKVPPVIDPFDAIKQRKDLSYLDLPPDLLKKLQPRVQVKPVPERRPQIDRKTLEAMNKPTLQPPTPPKLEAPVQPQPQPTVPPKTESPVEAPPPPPKFEAPVHPQPHQTVPPKTESPVEPPPPTAVPARPNFAMGSKNPAD